MERDTTCRFVYKTPRLDDISTVVMYLQNSRVEIVLLWSTEENQHLKSLQLCNFIVIHESRYFSVLHISIQYWFLGKQQCMHLCTSPNKLRAQIQHCIAPYATSGSPLA